MNLIYALITVAATLTGQIYNHATDETTCIYRTDNGVYTQVYMGRHTCPGVMIVEE